MAYPPFAFDPTRTSEALELSIRISDASLLKGLIIQIVVPHSVETIKYLSVDGFFIFHEKWTFCISAVDWVHYALLVFCCFLSLMINHY